MKITIYGWRTRKMSTITRNQTRKHQPELDNPKRVTCRCVVPGGAEGI
jgi:hypothetical protein